MPFSLLLYLQLKLAKRELSKIGDEVGKTLAFGKQNHSHGHVCWCGLYLFSFLCFTYTWGWGAERDPSGWRAILDINEFHFILCECHVKYRMYSNMRRCAYLIFRATSAALIWGRRLFEGGAFLNIVQDKFTFSDRILVCAWGREFELRPDFSA